MSSKETANGDLQPLPEVTMEAMLSHSCGRGESEQRGMHQGKAQLFPPMWQPRLLPDTGPARPASL